MNSTSVNSVIRVLYKEIRVSDVRKLLAQSNDSDTGGGARDIRFRNFDKLKPVITKFFPTQTNKSNVIHSGDLYWLDAVSGKTVCKVAEFWEPTDARPGEGRLARVHHYDCFAPARMTSANSQGGKILLLLAQLSDQSVWPHYVSENSLRTNKSWDARVSSAIINCLDAGAGKKTITAGYIDLIGGARFCNHD